MALATGGDFEATFSAMQRLAPVRGRLERAVISRAGAPVYIDYAHTPDALEAAIAALRPHVSNRLITVFGAGGDRDAGKRPEMGAVAANLIAQQHPFNAIFLVSDPAQKWLLLANFLLYFLPFLAGAFFIGTVLLRSRTAFNRVYFATSPAPASAASRCWRRCMSSRRRT